MRKGFIRQEFEDLKAAAALLEASLGKFQPYRKRKTYSPEELEYYDSLSFRFEKTVELTLGVYKGLEAVLYGRFSDTIRERLLKMQKIGLIDNVDFWLEARLLRNKVVHAYLPDELKDIYNEIFSKGKRILRQIKKIERYLGARQ